MKVLNLYLGSIAIKKWYPETSNTNCIRLGTQEDNCDYSFKAFPTKKDIALYHNQFSKLINETTSTLLAYENKYEVILKSLLEEIKKYDRINLVFASGGLFSSICVLILTKYLKDFNIISSKVSLNLPDQNFIISQLIDKKFANSKDFIEIPTIRDETLETNLKRLDDQVIKQIKQNTCGYCYHFTQTGMSTDMGGNDCGYCNILRSNNNSPLNKARRVKDDFCNINKTDINYLKQQLKKEKIKCIKNKQYESAAMLRDRIRALNEKINEIK